MTETSSENQKLPTATTSKFVHLSLTETTFYFFIWIASIIYAFYEVYKAGDGNI